MLYLTQCVQTCRYTFAVDGSLHIHSAQVTDTGRYLCMATNQAGTQRKRVDLQVYGEWYIHVHKTEEYFSNCLNHPQTQSPSNFMILCSHLSVPPSIADGRTNVTVTVNVQTTLSCEVTGIPKPTVSWMKNSRAINTDQNQNMYRLIQVFSLSVFLFKIKNSQPKILIETFYNYRI